MDGVASQSRAVFLQLEFFGAGSATNGIVVISGLFTDQKHSDDFLFALGHSQISAKGITIGPNVLGHGFYASWTVLTSPKILDFQVLRLAKRLDPA